MPVVGTNLVHDASVVSSYILVCTWLSREIEYWALCVTRIGKHTDTLVGSTCLSHIDGLRKMIGSTSYIENVASLQCSKSLYRVTKRFVDTHTITSTIRCQVIIFSHSSVRS